MTDQERETIEHPSWCDQSLCTAPEFRPTHEEYAGPRGPLGAHRSKMLTADKNRPSGGLLIFLSQQVAPWDCATYLYFQVGEGEYPDVISTEVGDMGGGVGFGLFELLAEDIGAQTRRFPTLYGERFGWVADATSSGDAAADPLDVVADEATADAVMPRDPVELEEQIAAESPFDVDPLPIDLEGVPPLLAESLRAMQGENEEALLEPMPFRLTVNGRVATRGTLQEIRAAVAELVSVRLAAAPERVATDALTINMAWNSDVVKQVLAERGEWFTVLDAHGEDPQRIKVTREA